MLDIGWWEMAVVAAIALLIIGPKDLPRVLRVVGQWAGKARRMAREFQGNIDEMIRDSELAEVKKEVERVGHVNPEKEVEKAIDPTGSLSKALDMSEVEGKGNGAAASAAPAEGAGAPASAAAKGAAKPKKVKKPRAQPKASSASKHKNREGRAKA